MCDKSIQRKDVLLLGKPIRLDILLSSWDRPLLAHSALLIYLLLGFVVFINVISDRRELDYRVPPGQYLRLKLDLQVDLQTSWSSWIESLCINVSRL